MDADSKFDTINGEKQQTLKNHPFMNATPSLTKVTKTTEQPKNNLLMMETMEFKPMGYLHHSHDLLLILSSDDDNVVKWWVDASCATLSSYKIHMGATMTLRKSASLSISAKQQLNETSSVEAELVGACNVMSCIIWVNYFLEVQGHGTKSSLVCQCNKLAMLLESNGEASSNKHRRHINTHYFFMMDRIKKKEL